jgi:hypothetical protein
MPLPLIRELYADDVRFARGLSGLLAAGEVLLVTGGGTELPRWRWRDVLADPAAWEGVRVRIAEAGGRRIG